MTKFYHNLSVQVLRKPSNTVSSEFKVICKTVKNINKLLHKKIFNFILEEKTLAEDFQNLTKIFFIVGKPNFGYNIEKKLLKL